MSMLKAGEKCTISNTGEGREKQKATDIHTQHVVLLIFAFSLSRSSHLELHVFLHRAETARELTAIEYFLDKVKGLKVDNLVKWHGDIDSTDQVPFRVPCFPGGEDCISPQQEKDFTWVFFSLAY